MAQLFLLCAIVRLVKVAIKLIHQRKRGDVLINYRAVLCYAVKSQVF